MVGRAAVRVGREGRVEMGVGWVGMEARVGVEVVRAVEVGWGAGWEQAGAVVEKGVAEGWVAGLRLRPAPAQLPPGSGRMVEG